MLKVGQIEQHTGEGCVQSAHQWSAFDELIVYEQEIQEGELQRKATCGGYHNCVSILTLIAADLQTLASSTSARRRALDHHLEQQAVRPAGERPLRHLQTVLEPTGRHHKGGRSELVGGGVHVQEELDQHHCLVVERGRELQLHSGAGLTADCRQKASQRIGELLFLHHLTGRCHLTEGTKAYRVRVRAVGKAECGVDRFKDHLHVRRLL
mmetsp:Transcript_707/g.2173  ORF Transcript_707/g.2173 Transcript_707/m.2173 type:complete len:210 (+) Transcript_707:289-918(+)